VQNDFNNISSKKTEIQEGIFMGKGMAKHLTKRAYHKHDSDSLNRTALLIGGVSAVVILLLIIGSQLL
jgi:hypothetical protein